MTTETESSAERDAALSRFVAHLPFTAATLAEAKQYARMLARTIGGELPEVDVAEATVSVEGDSTVHYRLICDRRLDDGRRCVLRADHEVPCAARRRHLTEHRRI